MPLTELEEALVCTAATGLTGLNLGDLDPVRGMSTLVQWTTRTWPSSCSNHGTELFFTNDDGLHMLRLFDMVPEPGEIATLSGLDHDAQVARMLDQYRRARVRLSEGRAPLPTTMPGLFDFNQWNANQPGTTLLVPVTNTTLEYINLLFIYLSRSYGFSLVDKTRGRRSAGLDDALASGRLDPARQMGIVELEQRVLSMLVVEQAFICQNVNLALQALGLGGWTFTGYLARFMMGGGDVPGLGFRFVEAADGSTCPVGRDGVFEAFTPPYHADMHDAVDAFMAVKWSAFEDDVPNRTSRRTPWWARCRAAPRGRRAGEALLPVRARHVRPLPGLHRPDVPAPHRAGPARRPRLLRALLPAGRAHRAALGALRPLASGARRAGREAAVEGLNSPRRG